MKKTITAAALLAALALVGCSAGNQSAEPVPSPTAAPSASASASSAPSESASSSQTAVKAQGTKESQERADEIMDLFLQSYDRTEFKEFSDGTPHQLIKSWHLDDDGKKFVITVGNDANTFQWLALDFLERTHEKGDIESVTVLNESNWGATRTLSDLPKN